MKIAIAGDSAGKPLVDIIETHLKTKGEHTVTNLSQSGFYADLSAGVANAVKDNERQLKQLDENWSKIKTAEVPKLNDALKRAGLYETIKMNNH